MTNQHRKQSRQPKPLSKDQLIQQFTRGMAELGYSVNVDTGNGRYTPKLNLQVWDSLDKKDTGIKETEWRP